MEWGVRNISGSAVIDGEEHFWVDWDETLMPRSALKNAEELITKFKARCRAKLELKSLARRPNSAEGGLAITGNDILVKIPHKKLRGRPRKQA
jgi:hypothetical protein